MGESYNAAVDMVDRNVAQGRGATVAFIDPARRLTYGELAESCARVAPMLGKLGLQREDRVAMMALDTVDFPVLFWGAIRAGIIPVPLNTLLTAEQYRYILEDSRAKVLFVSAPLLAVAQQAATGIASCVAVSAERTCAGMSSSPSSRWRKIGSPSGASRAMKRSRSPRTSAAAFSWITRLAEVWRMKSVSSPVAMPLVPTQRSSAGVISSRPRPRVSTAIVVASWRSIARGYVPTAAMLRGRSSRTTI